LRALRTDEKARFRGVHPATAFPAAHQNSAQPEPTGHPMNDLTATQAARPSDDSLLHALVWLTRHHGTERSAESLLFGQPTNGLLEPSQALRVLEDAGYDAGLIERRADDIHPLLLPAVLLMRGGRTCILLRRHEGDAAPYDVLIPGKRPHALALDAGTIAAEYTGFALVATPRQSARAETPAEAEGALPDPSRHWLWGNLRRFAPYYRQAMLAALLSNVLTLATGLVTSIVFDKVIPHQSFVTLWALASGATLALLFDMASRQIRSHLIDQAGKKADLLVGSLLFRQTLAVRMEHKPASAGSYAHTLAQVELVRDFFTSATLSALTDLPFVALFVVMIFAIGGPLGWVMVGAIPLILGVAGLMQASLRRSMSASMAHQAELQGVLVESIEGLEDLKAAGAHGQFLRRYERATVAAADAALKSRSISSWTNNLSSAAQQLVTIVMLVWGVYLIQAGQVTGGALIGAVMFAGRAIGPLSAVVGLATRYQGARAAMTALDRLMSLPVEREPGKAYVPNHRVSGRMALHDVSFAYPQTGAEPSPRVLANASLRIEPGERVAILGRIGSGKSTILRLLGGLYAPSEGRVEVDGLDLRQIDPADFRSAVGFVSQEPRLFNGSLRDNVTMGRAGIDASRLAEVARLTGLDRVIAAHPQGWELPVGEMGGMLSGGQRQLVALARCLATQPQLLLMDEPTSSMDAQSEVAFLRQLKEAAGTRTLVMVTHRPAVLDLAERLIVIDNGKVLIDGPKAQVLAALSGAKPGPAAAQEQPQPSAQAQAQPASPATGPAPAPAATPIPTAAPAPASAAARPATAPLAATA